MGRAIPNHTFHQGLEWFTKAIQILDLPSFASSEKFGSFIPINSKLILSPKNIKSSWTLEKWDGSYIPLTLILTIFYRNKILNNCWSTIWFLNMCLYYASKILSSFWKIEAQTPNLHSNSATLPPKAGIRSNIELNEKRNENIIEKLTCVIKNAVCLIVPAPLTTNLFSSGISPINKLSSQLVTNKLFYRITCSWF